MDENLKSAITKMGMSSCPSGLMMSIDFILKHSPAELDDITNYFNLNDEETEAFNSYVESRKNKSNFSENKMKKRIIKLTESDIEKLVKKILKEESNTEWMGNTYNMDQHSQEEMNRVWVDLNELNNDEIFDLMELTFNEEKMSVEDFVNHLPTNFGYDYDYIVSVLKQIKNEGI